MTGIALVVDTNIFVSARNRHEAGSLACRAFLKKVDNGGFRAIVSTLTVAELRAGFSDPELPTVWRPLLSHLVTSPNYQVAPVTYSIAERAGELRARRRLALADATIVATGLELGANELVTQDFGIGQKQQELRVRPP